MFAAASTRNANAVDLMALQMKIFLPGSEQILQLSDKLVNRKELKEKLPRINLLLLLLSKKPKESLPKKEPIELQPKSKPPENLLKLVKPKELNKQELKLLLNRNLLELLPNLRLKKLPELLRGEKL